MTYASPDIAIALRRERNRARSSERAREMRELVTFHDSGRIIVPEDVERRLVHVPCMFCGVAGACKHRPWA